MIREKATTKTNTFTQPAGGACPLRLFRSLVACSGFGGVEARTYHCMPAVWQIKSSCFRTNR